MTTFDIYKFIHVIGLAMIFGASLISFILIAQFFKSKVTNLKITLMASHFIVGTGLLLAIISGLLMAWYANWSYFKNAGYMHSKMLCVFVFFILLTIDIRMQKNMQRRNPKNERLVKYMKSRFWINLFLVIDWLIIAILIILRPF